MTSSAELYGERYAEAYPALYIAPWRRKHDVNILRLTEILAALRLAEPHWLDAACGQAWHFRQFPGQARMTGFDLSLAQLRRAKAGSPQAHFVCADALAAPFRSQSFDLVTCFWAAYCYFGDEAAIAHFLASVCDWLKPGGTVYLEVLLARDLASFNISAYAARTGFQVKPISSDYVRWCYDDIGGQHVMTSPELGFFETILGPRFASFSAEHDGGFMVHLVASGFKG